uniref:Uncharacterized protein n=2 Tax=Lotharella globosa TaxID=91324 RepID=A0A7S4DYL5_9EUKA
MLVFNMADPKSFENCRTWLAAYKEATHPVPFKGILVGTKADLKEDNAVMVDPDKVLDFANANKIRYFATSAKEAKDVEDPFHFIANDFYKNYEEEVKHLMHGMHR